MEGGIKGMMGRITMGTMRITSLRLRQQTHSQNWREQDRDQPGSHQSDPHDPKYATSVFPRGRPRKSHRQKSGDRDERPGKHRKCSARPSKGGRIESTPTLLHLHRHHLDGDDRIINEQSQGENQRAQGDPIQVHPHAMHDHQRDR